MESENEKMLWRDIHFCFFLRSSGLSKSSVFSSRLSILALMVVYQGSNYFTLVQVCCSLCLVFLMRLRLNHRGFFYFWLQNTWHDIKSIKNRFFIFNLQPAFPQMVFQLFKSTHTAFCRACMSVMVTVQLFHLNPWAIRGFWNMRKHAEFGKMRFFDPKNALTQFYRKNFGLKILKSSNTTKP